MILQNHSGQIELATHLLSEKVRTNIQNGRSVIQKIANMFPHLDENNIINLVNAYVMVHELAHHGSMGLEGEGTAEQQAEQFLEDAKKIFVNYVTN